MASKIMELIPTMTKAKALQLLTEHIADNGIPEIDTVVYSENDGIANLWTYERLCRLLLEENEVNSPSKSITPKFLESKGFKCYNLRNEDEFDQFPSVFDVEFSFLSEVCYLETKFDRNQFCVILEIPHGFDDEYKCHVFVQENVGCGFVKIPNKYRVTSENDFALLYEAIRRDKL